MPKPERHQLIGVLLTSAGALALEVILTRIFSVTMWYHFAFLAVSLALMGSAVAGVFLYLSPTLSKPEQARRWIGWAALTLALSVPVTFILYLLIPFRPVLMNRTSWFSEGQLFWLLLIYVDLSVPFFLSGLTLSLALSGWAQDAGRIYWADLTGASLGCLFSILALETLGGAGAMLAVAVILALAGVTFTRSWSLRTRTHKLFLGVTALLLLLPITNAIYPWLRIRVNKAGGEEATPAYERWNANSRVTVYEPVNYPFFWAVSDTLWQKTIAEGGTLAHALLLIDGVAGTPIQNFNGDLNQVAFLRYDLTSFAYHLIDQPRTLVIGPGGGRDVLAALATNAPHVTAVEVNPAVIQAVRGPFADFAGHLYERNDVEVIIADARGYIERSPHRYDVIQASLIDTWAAGGSGAFALSENSLYTREAFQAYHNHLTERGILTISRWYLPGRPAETMRLVSTGMAGWAAAGVTDPRQHVVVIAHNVSSTPTEGLATVLFKRTPFTSGDVAAIQRIADDLGYVVVYAPGLTPYEEVGHFIAASDHDAFIADYPLDISPATDDRPFFFNLVLLGDLLDPNLSASGVYRTSMEAIYILFAVIGISFLFGLAIIGGLSWLSARRETLRRPPVRLLAYFALLGIAFMTVEIPTIQKLTVYLGRPVYSLAVVLFSLLLFSGLGSLWSGTCSEAAIGHRIRRVFGLLFILLLLHPLLSIPILKATIGLPLIARLLIAVGLLSVLGFLMGIPFPTGVRWTSLHYEGVIPWLWGVNGAMSVLGSALATTLAIHLGFRLTLLLAAGIYGLAGLLIARETTSAG